MQTQFIMENGKPVFAVIPIAEYERLLSDEELADYARAEGSDKTYPAEVAHRFAAGENPLRVFREWRGLTQEETAQKAGLSTNFISMLETGRRAMTGKTAAKLARVLDVDYDLLTD